MNVPQPPTLTESDLLELLPSGGVDAPEGALSAYEIATARGHCAEWARSRLKELHRAGKIGVAFRADVDMTGRRTRIPVYYRKV
jgi:hypothetical protein